MNELCELLLIAGILQLQSKVSAFQIYRTKFTQLHLYKLQGNEKYNLKSDRNIICFHLGPGPPARQLCKVFFPAFD